MNDKMPNLLLIFSECKDCGACCFNCGFLDEKTGCVDDSFRLSSRCASFPVIYGNPKKMGHKAIFGNLSNIAETDRDRWFIIDFEDCTLLHNELILNNLRWFLDDFDNGTNIQSFTVSFGETSLAVYIN